MSLSVYDPKKGCFVLKQWIPEKINAFHPDYIKTHEPDLMKNFRTNEANREVAITEKKKKLAPREYHTFAKAGLPKGVSR